MENMSGLVMMNQPKMYLLQAKKEKMGKQM